MRSGLDHCDPANAFAATNESPGSSSPLIDQPLCSRKLTRPESTCPMRIVQLTSNTRLAGGDPSECEEAILEVTREKKRPAGIRWAFVGRSAPCIRSTMSSRWARKNWARYVPETAPGQNAVRLASVRAQGTDGSSVETIRQSQSRRDCKWSQKALRGAASTPRSWCGEILRPFGAQKSNCTCSRAKRGLSRVVGVPHRLASTAGVAGSSIV